MSQRELAERAKVSRATINRLEMGRRRMVDLDILDRIAKALGVAPGLLIGEDVSGARKARN